MRITASFSVLRGAALLTWLLVGLPMVVALSARSDAQPLVRLLAWLAFGVLFWAANWLGLDRRLRLLLVGAQTAAVLTMTLTQPRYGLELALLVMVVAQLPDLVSPRVAAVWMVVQTALLYLPGLWSRPLDLALQAGLGLGFQVFALGAVFLARREQRAREELARLNGELQAAQLLLADRSRLAERVRISRDLHDVLGHHLTALSLNLEVARHLAQGPAGEPVRTAHGLARQLLSQVRQVVGSLREEERSGLGQALRALVAGIPRPVCHLRLPDDVDDLAGEAQVVLRCVQEIITNAVRHAGARNLWIEIERVPRGLRIHARDDGRGAPELRPGHGLRGMRERLEEAGGGLELKTGPGSGFEVTALLAAPQVAG